MEAFDFTTLNGLSSMRYWPKMACNEHGDKCGLGGSGGPGQSCVVGTGPNADYSHCAPPIDTKFEASFGQVGAPCDASNPGLMAGCDYVDMSLVDGYTLPFRLDIHGDCIGSNLQHVSTIDCSGLSLQQCPTGERLGAATADLRAVNPNTGLLSGCYGPCMKLIDAKWNNSAARGRHAEEPGIAPFCCTTPPVTPEQCSAGPVKDTAYVVGVHSMCPGVYGFSYDDGMGLMRCQAGSQYDLTFFCPAVLPKQPQPREREGRSFCEVGSEVLCPGSETMCAGDNCCPDGSACPSAPSGFAGCRREKLEDCTKPGAHSAAPPPERPARASSTAPPPKGTAKPSTTAPPPKVTAKPGTTAPPPKGTAKPGTTAPPPKGTAKPSTTAPPPKGTAKPSSTAPPPKGTAKPSSTAPPHKEPARASSTASPPRGPANSSSTAPPPNKPASPCRTAFTQTPPEMMHKPCESSTAATTSRPPPEPVPAASPSCGLGEDTVCPGIGVVCTGNQCCPDDTTCPSAFEDFHDCKRGKTANCTGSTTPAQPQPESKPEAKPVPRAAYVCKLGEKVQCPGVPGTCTGNQCCSDGSTCPSAGNDFVNVCRSGKREDCLQPGSAGFVVRRFDVMLDGAAEAPHRPDGVAPPRGHPAVLAALAPLTLLTPALVWLGRLARRGRQRREGAEAEALTAICAEENEDAEA